MLTRRELLIGGAAAIVSTAVGRRAWGAMAPAANAAVPAGSAVAAASPLDAIIGESPAVVALRDSIRALLDGASTRQRPPLVVLVGESGAGKELVAQVIHRAGPRHAGPYVSRNVYCTPESVVDLELWGCVPGALMRGFLVHAKGMAGAWELAHGGTLLLDEVDQMRAGYWAKIARAIEASTIRRLGAKRSQRADVWPIMTAHASLDIPSGRQTLRERLAPLDPVILTVPPLRERGDDVQLIADHFIAHYCREHNQPLNVLTPGAREALAASRWPGNVQQLSNVMERAVILSARREIDADLIAM